MSILRRTGYVKRLHAWPTVTQQDLAQHQWNVARIYIECFHTPDEDSAGIQHALFHDRGEFIVGDIPAPSKRWIQANGCDFDELEDREASRIIELPKPSERQAARVKFCDSWELVEHAIHERKLGNSLMLEVEVRAAEYASERFKALDAHDQQCAAMYINENYPEYRVEIDE
jgi:5'-deoxynucleotidase YfbR-like HD superfamily hydrolase